jgi:hypothetical protein
MTIKNLVIRVNDFICYIGFAIVCLSAFLTGMVNPIHGAIVGVVGLVLFSLFAGLWFVLSLTGLNSQKQVELLQKQNTLLLKISKELEANSFNEA